MSSSLGIVLATMWTREVAWVPPPLPAGIPARVTPLRRTPSLIPAGQDLNLASPMPALPPFKRCESREVLDWVPSIEANSININWPTIEAAGMRMETWVPRAASPAGTFGSRLADLLTPIGLAFATDGYGVYVSTPADVARLGHMRHISRFTLTTRADAATIEALQERSYPFRRPVPIGFAVERGALRDAGISFEIPRRWQVHPPTGAMLEATLRQASAPTLIRYEIRGGQLVISTAAALEAADRHRMRLIVFSAIGAFVAFVTAMILARRRTGTRRALCLAFALVIALIIIVPIWRVRPDFASARVGRSRWIIGLGPQRTFVLTDEPERIEEPFLNRQSNGPAPEVYWRRFSFTVVREGSPFPSFFACGPRWAVIAIAGVLPLAWLGLNVPPALSLPRRLRERRRVRSGRCARCGYDLRGSTDRCPECGTPVPA
jgi:hypothetical protein